MPAHLSLYGLTYNSEASHVVYSKRPVQYTYWSIVFLDRAGVFVYSKGVGLRPPSNEMLQEFVDEI